jgi:hypothetical protein
MPMTELEKAFDQTMFDIYRRADKEVGYRPTIFLDMLHKRGGIATARALITAAKPSDGYTRLFEKQRLDLTVEAVVVDEPRWHPLFTAEELAQAQKRLKAYHYKI